MNRGNEVQMLLHDGPKATRTVRRGFSLVELVVVVVIIGILAAIAARRFSSGSAQASESALQSSLVTLRKAIDLYAVEHINVYPGAANDGKGNAANSPAAFVNQMTLFSSVNGGVSGTRDTTFNLGPYVRTIPPAPVGKNKGSSDVAIDDVNPRPLVTGGAEGWVYNPATGEIIVNTDDANLKQNRTYDEY